MLFRSAEVQPLLVGSWWLQAFTASGAFGDVTSVGPAVAMEEESVAATWAPFTFVNASAHLKENLKFLLQWATINQPFTYTSNLRLGGASDTYTYPENVESPESFYARPSTQNDYEYYGFHTFSPDLNYSIMQEFHPVQENCIWGHTAIASLAMSSGNPDRKSVV